MCFSATASFAVAAATAMTGAATLRHVRRRREVVLAAVPLLFAAQQAVEGVLWRLFDDVADGVSPDSGAVTGLAFLFLIFAKVVWPVYTPLAVLLIEPSPRRRQAAAALLVVGAAISLYLLADMIATPPTAAVWGHSIRYASAVPAFSWEEVPYLLCTCLPLVLSSHRTVRVFGAVVVLGFVVSAWLFVTTYVSVWCFFAAADSTLLYLYFKHAALAADTPRAAAPAG